MKGCSSTTIIWLLFAFLLIFPLYTKHREKLNFFVGNVSNEIKKVTINLIEHFFTYKWDHFLSYFISLNSGSLSFITILVSTYIKNLLQKKLENLLIYRLPFGIEEVNVEFVLK